MRRIIVEEWMSLDGYVSDKNNQLDFFTSITPEQNTYSDRDQLAFLETVDIILLGRITYELFAEFWPGATTDKELIADRLNKTKKLVVSNTLSTAPWGKWPAAEIVSGNAVAAIKALKMKEGKNIVVWGSISLAQVLMKQQLVDEFRIQLCPVLTGGGKRLFDAGMDAMPLRLLETRQYKTGVVFLQYQARS
jgi:dihydrofolate reductase